MRTFQRLRDNEKLVGPMDLWSWISERRDLRTVLSLQTIIIVNFL